MGSKETNQIKQIERKFNKTHVSNPGLLAVLFHSYLDCFCFLQIAASENRVYLNAGTLMLNLQEGAFDEASNKLAINYKKK